MNRSDKALFRLPVYAAVKKVGHSVESLTMVAGEISAVLLFSTPEAGKAFLSRFNETAYKIVDLGDDRSVIQFLKDRQDTNVHSAVLNPVDRRNIGKMLRIADLIGGIERAQAQAGEPGLN
jgi:hypothetical protein